MRSKKKGKTVKNTDLECEVKIDRCAERSVDIVDIVGIIGRDPEKVKTDSRKVRKGDMFVAIKGTFNDGHDFISDVVKSGAAVVVCDHAPDDMLDNGGETRIAIVNDTKKAMGAIAKNIFNDPVSKLKMYGVTGTNGKTTSVFLTHKILSLAGVPSGIVSTVYNITKDEYKVKATMTTPDIVALYGFLSAMRANHKDAAVVEISSHALSQERVCGLELDSAIFTNITPEHLDYHKTMENYLNDKMKIFNMLRKDGIGVMNVDDDTIRKVACKNTVGRTITFGIDNNADVMASDIRLSASSTEFTVQSKDFKSFHVKTKLIGMHNVYNILGVTASLLYTGVDSAFIKKGCELFHSVPGRLSQISTNAPFKVFVDYAHTPDALERTLRCMRSLSEKKLIAVFGCGGNRDRTKRPVMGKLAAEICDQVYVTSDNPRNERPEDIINEIEKGMTGKKNYSLITKREDAIAKAIKLASQGDIIVIAGKGHENYQIIGEKMLHFDDKEVASLVLREMGYAVRNK
ncbi:MAG TPA: UDP-N-acetylmuramoyl-L-alanyl-D-glutamate--2,6-diaminopimelate ligase [Candidatus Omnitrophota bacterium]|nr:UDP-N-acetylmuramoyl-L-alanyl-D-glutamate--2,6-diaminopimelate ligase [Candidatus Omnitrophota bacterium]HPS20025.1 UDP-N-acetylmuramoyl-L-alanyl-D-glutamate--2,6-diaminopimelate ligase [Candidatus Omnitrophota bacterium]